MAHYSRKLKTSFQDALQKIMTNLEHQGFDIITSIDFRDAFRKKLQIGFRNYKILGVCNPQLAYKAITLESHMGTLLTCNIVIQEHENGEVEVSAINPLENIDKVFDTTQLVSLASEVGVRLRAALDYVERDASENFAGGVGANSNLEYSIH